MRSTPPSALLISPAEQDHEILRFLFDEQGWTLYSAQSLGSGAKLLRDTVATVVITEAHLPVGTWRDVLSAMSHLSNPPPVIVASLHADDYLWAEALNLGAHDVLVKPFDRTEVVRVLTAAWMRCKGENHQGEASNARKAG